LYWKTTSAGVWTGSLWSTVAGGPYTSAWASGSDVVFEENGGTTLTITGATTAFTSLTVNENVTVTPGGTIGTGGTVATIDVASGKTLTFGSQGISTAAGTGFIKNGQGSWSLLGGGYRSLVVNAGTLLAGGVNGLGNGTLTVNGGKISSTTTAAKDFSGKLSAITIGGDFTLGDATNSGALTFDGPTSLGAVVRTITVSSPVTWAGVISGGGGITKEGASTLTLSAGNLYLGATTVNAGTLLATNATGSATGTGAVSIASAGTFGGIGTVAPTGSNGVSIAGALAPGVPGTNNGIGTLTFTPVNGNVTLQSGSSMQMQIASSTSYDKVAFNASGSGVLNFTAMGSGSIHVQFAGYTPALNDTFDLIDWLAVSGSGIAGLSASQLDLPTTGFSPGWMWNTSSFASSGVVSIINSVPEPSRAMLFLAGLAGLAMARRRSR
jgi:autotransporter-associated beta strand protein